MSRKAVECECFKVIPVPDGASAPLRCSCGRFVVVPEDDEFQDHRVLLSATTLERRIRRLLAEDQLPPERECAWCGSMHAEPLDVRFVCERAGNSETGFLRFLMTLGFFWRWWEEQPIEIPERDNTVLVPLCACESCAQACRPPEWSKTPFLLAGIAVVVVAAGMEFFVPFLGLVVGFLLRPVVVFGLAFRSLSAVRRWERDFKDKLRRVPVYAQLLRDYPRGVVMLPEWFWLDRCPHGPSRNAAVA